MKAVAGCLYGPLHWADIGLGLMWHISGATAPGSHRRTTWSFVPAGVICGLPNPVLNIVTRNQDYEDSVFMNTSFILEHCSTMLLPCAITFVTMLSY